MKPSIVNSTLLQKYLEGNFWKRNEEPNFIRYTPDIKAMNLSVDNVDINNMELLVPREIVDRPGLYSVMELLWSNLSKVYGKTEKEIITEILYPNTEIIELYINDEDTQDGSISYNKLIDFMTVSKGLLVKNLVQVSNQVLLNPINSNKIRHLFKQSKVIGIEKGSFILKIQIPKQLDIKDKDMFSSSTTVRTEQSIANAIKNVDFFRNEIIPTSTEQGQLEKFVGAHLEEIQTDVLSATFAMINKFPKSLIKFYSSDSEKFSIDSKEYSKQGIEDIKQTIKKITEEQKQHYRESSGIIYELEDKSILNGQEYLSIHIKDEEDNLIHIPYIDLAYKEKIVESLKDKQKVLVKGIQKNEKKNNYKITKLETFEFLSS